MVTHDLDTLVALSHRVAVLADQKLIAIGPVHEIAQCDHPFIHNFFHGERGQRAMMGVEPAPQATSALAAASGG
jgi:phospholipid/cholesterol/gamma-HCH transport system ATP-binding protein